MHWLAQAMIATIGFAVLILLVTHLTQLGINPTVINLYLFIFSTIGFSFYGLVIQRTSLAFPAHTLPTFIALGCIAVIANSSAVNALSSAPNPGLVRTVQSMEAVVVTIAAIFIYKAKIEPRQVIGILLMISGLFLVSYKS